MNLTNRRAWMSYGAEMCVQELDLERFEELFKTRAQGPIMDLSCTKSKVAQKAVNKVTILDANRSKNLAITLRKANKTSEEICKAIEKYVLRLTLRRIQPGKRLAKKPKNCVCVQVRPQGLACGLCGVPDAVPANGDGGQGAPPV